MSSADDFARELHEFSRRTLPELFGKDQQRIALDALKRVVDRTPFDTGRAKGNWQVGVNEIPENKLSALDKEGAQTIEKGQRTIKGIKFGDDVFIANNLDYILALEHGHAPATVGSGENCRCIQ